MDSIRKDSAPYAMFGFPNKLAAVDRIQTGLPRAKIGHPEQRVRNGEQLRLLSEYYKRHTEISDQKLLTIDLDWLLSEMQSRLEGRW